MILKTRHGERRRDHYMFESASRIPGPLEAGGRWSQAGQPVDFDRAMGVPAAFAAVRLIAETVGQLELAVVRSDTGEPVRDAAQWELLHDRPNPLQGPMMVQSYLAASMERGNAYLQKIKDPDGRVLDLWALDPRRVTPKVQAGQVTYELAGDRDQPRRILTRREVIHIPGVLLSHPLIGVSPVEVHVDEIGAQLALAQFKSRFFANDATPGGVIKGGPTDRDQRQELREAWEARHQGSGSRGRVAVLWGQMEFQSIGVSAVDAAMIDALRLSVQDTARIYRVPSGLIGDPDAPTAANPEVDNLRFLQFSLGPRLRRIEDALHMDDDLFPDKALRPRFLTDQLLRADIKTRYEAYRLARQGGWITPNEIRSRDGLPPVDGGDDIQVTPVGGAPNPAAPPAT